MTNLNKTYHKGKYRGGEWGKHIRPYLKRLGNKRFRKAATLLEENELRLFSRHKKKKGRKTIKVKITFHSLSRKSYSYYRSYRNMKDLRNAVNRPNVLRYFILDQPGDLNIE